MKILSTVDKLRYIDDNGKDYLYVSNEGCVYLTKSIKIIKEDLGLVTANFISDIGSLFVENKDEEDGNIFDDSNSNGLKESKFYSIVD